MKSWDYLLDGYLADNLTEEELQSFLAKIDEHDAELSDIIVNVLQSEPLTTNGSEDVRIRSLQKLLQSIEAQNASKFTTPKAHRVHFLRRGWFKYAAAIIALFFGTSIYFLTEHKPKQILSHGQQVEKNIIVPGKNSAILTLADGRSITLSNADNGVIAAEGNAQIKLNEGLVTYNVNVTKKENAVFNTMSTPPGGKYQLLLPDGSKIWLNSSSSVKYPTFFEGAERKIFVSGEIYLEVAKDKFKPFIVDVNGKSSVEVLGTSFNINSYVDESTIKTTLINGSILVKQNNKSFLLKPGQQLTGTNSISHPDIDQVIAWKNGYLNFENINIQTALRQISRWYNIKVRYEGAPSDELLVGKLPMDASFEQVLQMLKNIGIQYKLDGNTMIVLQ